MTQTRKVSGVATAIYGHSDKTIIRYHDTDVVEFTKDRIILRSGGWKTATTKLRMNQASVQFGLGYQVYQSKHDWYVSYGDNHAIPFEDGMILDRSSKTVATGDKNP